MEVHEVDISTLAFDPANTRKHPESNMAAIKGSLAKFGQQKPIVIDKNNVVIAGNGTLAAAMALGWKMIKSVRTNLEGPEAIAFALADNRAAELAEWDLEPLSKTLQGLKDIDFDLAAIGFDDDFMTAHTPEVINEGLTDPDEIPENVETRCKPGDLWMLGNHRLLCGDSTNVQHVERLMNGEKADMVFTDPPYGVNERTMRKSAGRGKLAEGHDFRPVIGDDSADTAIAAFNLCSGLGINGIWWGANYFAHSVPEVSSWLIWDKRNGVPSDDNADCEMAWVWNKKPARIFSHLWRGCIRASEKSESKVHPTQKPIALAEWCFQNYGNPKSVLDLFLGSGSTLIACEKTNRKCYGCEIDAHYCSVIIERWERFTGKKAELHSNV